MYSASFVDYEISVRVFSYLEGIELPSVHPMEGKSYTPARRLCGCSDGSGLCRPQRRGLARTQILEHLDSGLRLRALGARYVNQRSKIRQLASQALGFFLGKTKIEQRL